MTPLEDLWEEQLAIILGSEGGFTAEDVRKMDPRRRSWLLGRIKKIMENRQKPPRSIGSST